LCFFTKDEVAFFCDIREGLSVPKFRVQIGNSRIPECVGDGEPLGGILGAGGVIGDFKLKAGDALGGVGDKCAADVAGIQNSHLFRFDEIINKHTGTYERIVGDNLFATH